LIAISLLLQLVGAPSLPPAQIIVKRGTVATAIPVVTTTGSSTVRGGQLATALGGSLKAGANGHFTLTLPHARIDLIEGVPFVRVDSNTVPLVDPPELRGGELMLPLQIVTEIIPLYGGGQYELGIGRTHIQLLAAIFYADAPNDVAPVAFPSAKPTDDVPASPLDVRLGTPAG